MKYVIMLSLILFPVGSYADELEPILWNGISKGQSLDIIAKTDKSFERSGNDLHKDAIIEGNCHIHIKIKGVNKKVDNIFVSHGDFDGDDVYHCKRVLINTLQNKYGNPIISGETKSHTIVYVWRTGAGAYASIENLNNVGDIITYDTKYPKLLQIISDANKML